MGAEQGRVDVEDDLGRARPQRPRACSGARARRSDALQLLIIDRVDHPPRRRVRGDRPEQVGLIAKGPQIGQAVAAVREHHGQVANDPARIVGRGALAGRRHRRAEALGQPEPVGQLDQQRAPRMRDDSGVIRQHLYLLGARPTHHLHGDPPGRGWSGLRHPDSPRPVGRSRPRAALSPGALLQDPG